MWRVELFYFKTPNMCEITLFTEARLTKNCYTIPFPEGLPPRRLQPTLPIVVGGDD